MVLLVVLDIEFDNFMNVLVDELIDNLKNASQIVVLIDLIVTIDVRIVMNSSSC